MLTALTADNQELFSLIDCSIDELTQIRSEQAFVSNVSSIGHFEGRPH